ncbi:hypothetical protein [Kribbella sp. NPDC051620]|uniref:hypothetical protein n=1 Tax=Kribbella sp. NPDC051620 TaxID=3364120 RepID=UPI0037918AAD
MAPSLKLDLMRKNERLAAGLASVAVAAVVAGGVFASQQGPADRDSGAAPLPGPSSTPSTTPKPPSTPSPATATPPTPLPSSTAVSSTRPSNKPSTGIGSSTGPATVDVVVDKLADGRAPQLPYLAGREVRGGPGGPVKIPGTGIILAIARLNTAALAVVEHASTDKDPFPSGSDLVKVRYGEVEKTPNVSSLVGREDQSAVAYATTRFDAKGDRTKGSDLYAEVDDSVQRLELANSWNVEVLAYRGASVYFRAAATSGGQQTLFQWKPGTSKATSLKAAASPVTVTNDGTIAASLKQLNDGSCATVTAIESGTQLWRTCESRLVGFTPDSRIAVGVGASFEGSSETLTAHEARTGKLLRTWNGQFYDAVAEDDQHLLAVTVVSGNPVNGTLKLAIIRCSIPTGQCERATPDALDQSVILR